MYINKKVYILWCYRLLAYFDTYLNIKETLKDEWRANKGDWNAKKGAHKIQKVKKPPEQSGSFNIIGRIDAIMYLYVRSARFSL